MNFLDKYNSYLDLINKLLSKLFVMEDVDEARVLEAMKYSLMNGGKRIRPMITLAFCELLGGNIEDALVFGAAIECIHTYSLIHDDLPCMDNDDLRRGKPTCHKAFDEATAVLAGDGLLNFAFEYMSDFKNYKNVSLGNVLKAVNYISSSSGYRGMIGGQAIDLALENKDNITAVMLENLDKKKTAALIMCSAVAGVIAADGKDEDIEAAESFSYNLGLAFQIKDDILDYEGNTSVLGKNTGSDAENGKSTYVSVLGIDAAKLLLGKYTENAVSSLEKYGDKAEFLIELSNYLLNREW